METNNTVSELLYNSLKSRWEKYNQELARCQEMFSEEAVHDLRVATRRLLALLDLIGILYPNARTHDTLLNLKDQLDSYDDLRDTQVMLLEIGQRLEEFPTLTNFQKFIAKREKRLLKAAAKNVKSYKLNVLSKRINAILKLIHRPKQDSSLLLKNLFQTIDDVYASVLKRFRRIDPNIPPTIHRLRVRFKKFRYMVECIYPLIPDFPETNLRSMHDYQTLMGNIQDIEVLLSTLSTFAAKKNGHILNPVVESYQNQHTRTIQTYIERKEELSLFWRSSPTQPFPWEKQLLEVTPSTKKSRRKAKAVALQTDEETKPEMNINPIIEGPNASTS
jgi:CHAD domain-containing protein